MTNVIIAELFLSLIFMCYQFKAFVNQLQIILNIIFNITIIKIINIIIYYNVIK